MGAYILKGKNKKEENSIQITLLNVEELFPLGNHLEFYKEIPYKRNLVIETFIERICCQATFLRHTE